MSKSTVKITSGEVDFKAAKQEGHKVQTEFFHLKEKRHMEIINAVCFYSEYSHETKRVHPLSFPRFYISLLKNINDLVLTRF